MIDLEKFPQKQVEFIQCFLTIGDDFVEFDILVQLFQILDEEKQEFANILAQLTEKRFLFRKDTSFKLNPYIIDVLKKTFKPTAQNCDIFIYSFLNIFQPPYQNVREIYEFLFLKFISNLRGKSVNLGILFNYYARYLLYKKDYDNALKYNDLALEILTEKAPYHSQLAIIYNTKPLIFLEAKQYDKAIQWAFEAEKQINSMHFENQKHLLTTYKIIAEAYYAKGDYSKTREFAMKGLNTDNKDILSLISLYQLILLSSLSLKDYQQAYQANLKAIELYKQLPESLQDKKMLEELEKQKKTIDNIVKLSERTGAFAKKIRLMKFLILFMAIIALLLIIYIFIR